MQCFGEWRRLPEFPKTSLKETDNKKDKMGFSFVAFYRKSAESPATRFIVIVAPHPRSRPHGLEYLYELAKFGRGTLRGEVHPPALPAECVLVCTEHVHV